MGNRLTRWIALKIRKWDPGLSGLPEALQDSKDRLVHIEAKIDALEDSRQRLIHIEAKVDGVDSTVRSLIQHLELLVAGRGDAGGSERTMLWMGHADQQFGAYTYAQHGEDLVIATIFHNLGVARPSYIDLGAHHPLNISNTALLYRRGSRGINVEANPDLIPAFRQHRPEDVTLNVGVGLVEGSLPFYRIDSFSGRNSFSRETIDAFLAAEPNFKLSDTIDVPVLTLNQIVDRHAGGVFPDFLSIDVEGLDFAILESADFSRSRPSVICVEVVNGAGENSVAMINLLRGKGYSPYFATLGNILFVRNEWVSRLSI